MSAFQLNLPTRTLTNELIQRWVTRIRHIFTDRTLYHYTGVIWRFKDFAPDDMKDLTVEHIERYIDHICSKYTNRTSNAHLTVIKSFCRWVSEHYDLPNPAAKVKMLPEEPPHQRVLTYEEYQKVLSICTEQEREVIAFIANTGLRSSEILSLKWANISQDSRLLTVVGKGRKRRVVPLNATCQAILAKYPRKPSTIQFLESYKHRNNLYLFCKRLACRAAISCFGPHSLRHFFATRLMQKDVPLLKISKILGHSSVRVTERVYIHFSTQDIIGITDVLDE